MFRTLFNQNKIKPSDKYLQRIFPTLEAEPFATLAAGDNAAGTNSAQATPAFLAKLQEARASVQRLSSKLTTLENQLSTATQRYGAVPAALVVADAKALGHVQICNL